ncbi:MAG: peptide ABC transporter substrate-binding protein [Planctomycetes bacterium]|nr:peptide ABC transporter substrate-binding protein [Planctomycetota bacterium]MBI3846815.1 peptide ABC transporter substrate-binding protein [Planctomycetota bacterium]
MGTGLRAGLLGIGLFASCARGPRADFVAVLWTEVETFDPAQMTGVADGSVARALWEGLLVPGDRGPEPGIAERFDVSDDGLAYTFHLRDGLRFSDGSTLDAADVARSWARVVDPETAANNAALFDGIRGARDVREGRVPVASLGVVAPDPRTLVVTLETPIASFPDRVTLPPFYPVHLASIASHPDDWQQPGRLVCNGPYVLESWRVNDRMRLVRNPYFRERAPFGRIDFLSVESPMTAFNLYATGQADWLASVPRDVIPDIRDRPDLHIEPYLGVCFYRINVTRKPFDDPRVRRALSLAIDRDALVRHVTRAGERPATSFVPPLVPGYDPPTTSFVRFDPATARACLAEARLSSPLDVEILYASADVNREVALALQDQWSRQLGARVRLRNQEWKVYIQSTKSCDYDVARSSWIADYPDAESFLDVFRGDDPNNRTGWRSDRYDALLEAASRVRDRARRSKLLSEAERILLEEGPVLPLYFMVSTNLVRPSIVGFESSPMDWHLPHRLRRTA